MTRQTGRGTAKKKLELSKLKWRLGTWCGVAMAWILQSSSISISSGSISISISSGTNPCPQQPGYTHLRRKGRRREPARQPIGWAWCHSRVPFHARRCLSRPLPPPASCEMLADLKGQYCFCAQWWKGNCHPHSKTAMCDWLPAIGVE